ncbi:anthranilate synthase component I family protein [Brevundimonas sp. M20]|uniref:anthranilate synthase component I family protein n=1 Tax=Brevundimonas sp. M20 TaxID=2591463 RepID=UPI001146CA30|nr:anthranilate synthase component I family protein [Brevundimonas sp. M20]QDH74632.1 anthranilate synthase component I family protein [Brevundimonas sp. M20]
MTSRAVERRPLPWRDPLAVATGLRSRDGALALLSDGGPLGRWSFVAAEPDRVIIEPVEAGLDRLRDPDFADGVVGLLAYDAGARPATGPREAIWPDLMLGRYPAMLAFDHQTRQAFAIGRGADPAAAADRAVDWLAAAVDPVPPPPPADSLEPEAPPAAYEAAVADVVARIAAGELFQANIARAWTGALHPGADPFDVMLRLAGRASAYGAFWRLGDRAIVSNSPELFLTFDGSRIETRPIKGTRPRDPDPARDAALAAELQASAKDRAENLMIVDLMRNDLARAAAPGSVKVERLFEVEPLPTVHHLVSTVLARAAPGVGPADLLEATFPPGSITGAPKHQAMKVIAAHEPPRGVWCGSLFHIADGGLTASVLIRTAAFERKREGWRFRTLAGAGIVADSDPAAELAETEAKIRALREALIGP